jgi:uncharacterized membrane protein
MISIKNFIKTSFIGGISVILPSALLFFIFRWLFRLATDIVQPMTNLVISKSQIQEFVADIVVILLILTVCFVVGVIVKTKVGKFAQENLENRILKIAPGYSIIRETVLLFLGKKNPPFLRLH